MSGYQQGPDHQSPDDGRAWQDRYPQHPPAQDPQPRAQQQPWAPQPPPPGPMLPAPQQFSQYPPQQYPPQPVVFIPAKTPGLAVLFSFLWLGAGNCYAGQVGLGVAFIIAQVVCAPVAALLASATLGFSLIVTVPIWIAAFAISAVTGYNGCKEHNRTLGFPHY